MDAHPGNRTAEQSRHFVSVRELEIQRGSLRERGPGPRGGSEDGCVFKNPSNLFRTYSPPPTRSDVLKYLRILSEGL